MGEGEAVLQHRLANPAAPKSLGLFLTASVRASGLGMPDVPWRFFSKERPGCIKSAAELGGRAHESPSPGELPPWQPRAEPERAEAGRQTLCVQPEALGV